MLSVLESFVEEKDVEIDVVYQEWLVDFGCQFDSVMVVWLLYWNFDLQVLFQVMVWQIKKYFIIIDIIGLLIVWDYVFVVVRGGGIVVF